MRSDATEKIDAGVRKALAGQGRAYVVLVGECSHRLDRSLFGTEPGKKTGARTSASEGDGLLSAQGLQNRQSDRRSARRSHDL